MANNDAHNKNAKDSNLGTHPNGVDPSAPTVGTEGWGNTADEHRVLSPNDPQSIHDGQKLGDNTPQRKAHTFRCSDAGNSNCSWETAGDTQDEVMQKVVEHARDAHGMTDWSDALRDRVRDSIHRREAA